MFRLQPARGVTFGAVKFNMTPQPRRFELKNEGQFAFTFAVTGQDIGANVRKSIVAGTAGLDGASGRVLRNSQGWP